MHEDTVTITVPVETYPEWKNAVERFIEAEFTYGSRIPDAWFYHAFNLEQPIEQTTWREKQRIDLLFLRNITAMRNWLLTELQMLLWNSPQDGYEVLWPHEQTIRSMGEFNLKLTKEFSKVASRLRHTAIDQLTSEEQRQHTDACARVAQLSSMMLGSKRQARIEAARKASTARIDSDFSHPISS